MENQNNIHISIKLINDASVHAKRVTLATLNAAGVIDESIRELPFCYLENKEGEEAVKRYLIEIELLVDKFGKLVEKGIIAESKAIKSWGNIRISQMIREKMGNWQPLEIFTEVRLAILYTFFQERVESISRMFLYKRIDQIKYLVY